MQALAGSSSTGRCASITPGRNQKDRDGDVAQLKIIEKSKRIFAAIIIFRNNKYVKIALKCTVYTVYFYSLASLL